MNTQLIYDGAVAALWQPLTAWVWPKSRFRVPLARGAPLLWALLMVMPVAPAWAKPQPMPYAIAPMAQIKAKRHAGAILFCARGAACAQDVRHRIFASTPDSAQFFAWQDTDGLHVHVDVPDAAHHNAHQDGALWDGDSLELYLHPWSFTPWDRAAKSEGLLPGDLTAAFALTPKGSQGWLFAQGGAGGSGPWPTQPDIHHDETTHTTTYTLMIPWPLMLSGPGLSPALALGIAINRYAANGMPEGKWRYGVDAAGGFRPQTLPVFDLSPMPLNQVALAGGPQIRLEATDGLTVPFLTGAHGAELHVACGTATLQTRVPAHPAMAAANLTFWPPPSERGTCFISLQSDAGQPEAVAEVAFTTVAPQVHKADQKLQQWLLTAPNALIAGHIRALRGLLAETFARALSEGHSVGHGAAWEALALAEAIYEEAQNPLRWQTELQNGTRPLIWAVRSAGDDAMQPVLVYLPQAVGRADAQKPLVVFLHGKGDPSLAHFVADGCRHGGLGHAQAAIMVPWARGNLGQPGLAQSDIIAAVEAAQALLPIDPNRIYLSGFSMGGTQAWGLALHRPDVWAAVGIASGGTWLTALGHGLGGNAQKIPFWLWHGMADGTVDVGETHRMVQELQSHHVPYEAHYSVGQGHHFPQAERMRMMAWLLDQRRITTPSWQYTSDGPLNRERSGVSLRYDAQKSAFPTMTLVRTGDTYSFHTQGTAGLEVDLQLLAAEGPERVHVFYNDRPVYSGSKTTLSLGAGAPRP